MAHQIVTCLYSYISTRCKIYCKDVIQLLILMAVMLQEKDKLFWVSKFLFIEIHIRLLCNCMQFVFTVNKNGKVFIFVGCLWLIHNYLLI